MEKWIVLGIIIMNFLFIYYKILGMTWTMVSSEKKK
jgi:hypothetical protein